MHTKNFPVALYLQKPILLLLIITYELYWGLTITCDFQLFATHVENSCFQIFERWKKLIQYYQMVSWQFSNCNPVNHWCFLAEQIPKENQENKKQLTAAFSRFQERIHRHNFPNFKLLAFVVFLNLWCLLLLWNTGLQNRDTMNEEISNQHEWDKTDHIYFSHLLSYALVYLCLLVFYTFVERLRDLRGGRVGKREILLINMILIFTHRFKTRYF